MPELPEVETSRRILADALVGQPISRVVTWPDSIVFRGQPETLVAQSLEGQVVREVGRHGKFFWLQPESGPVVMAHLGMSGAILDLTPGGERSVVYRETKGVRMAETPEDLKFGKLWLETTSGRRVALVDPRRLARIWLAEDAAGDPQRMRLGPDAWLELPEAETLAAAFARRKAPIKALLLDQSFLAGVGNYLADEVLYHAGIAPHRPANELNPAEVEGLHRALREVIQLAVEVEADSNRFPETWLFHVRWGGTRGADEHMGDPMRRDQVGGRTTAWVPNRQR